MTAGFPVSMPVSMILEATLGLLLLATLFVCARLEYRLKRLRADQKELAGTITALNTAVTAAGRTLVDLRQTAKETGEGLGRQVNAARTLADELSLLSAAGERVAGRIEASRMAVSTAGSQPRKMPKALRSLAGGAVKGSLMNLIKTSPTDKRPRNMEVRLLPAVIGVGLILIALKISGLAFPASAATEAAATNAPAASNSAPKPASDPLGKINAALPVPTAKANADNPAASGRSADDLPLELAGAGVSSAEMDVLTSLSDRRDALEGRERQLDLRANLITAAEKRVDDKILQLKDLQTKIESLLGQRDQMETAQLDGLVKVYTAMKPKDAARIFAALDDSVRLGVAGRMKSDTMAGIMAALPPDVAQKITVELASRYALPAETAAAASTASAPAPTPHTRSWSYACSCSIRRPGGSDTSRQQRVRRDPAEARWLGWDCDFASRSCLCSRWCWQARSALPPRRHLSRRPPQAIASMSIRPQAMRGFFSPFRSRPRSAPRLPTASSPSVSAMPSTRAPRPSRLSSAPMSPRRAATTTA